MKRERALKEYIPPPRPYASNIVHVMAVITPLKKISRFRWFSGSLFWERVVDIDEVYHRAVTGAEKRHRVLAL